MTKTKQDAVSLATRFERAREALFAWEDFDEGNEFYVKNKVMVDRRDGSGIAAIIEHKPEGVKTPTQAGFVAVSFRYSALFNGTHLVLDRIPVNGIWDDVVHAANRASINLLLERIYESEALEPDMKAQEMLATRRMALLYARIWPGNDEIVKPSEYERLIVVDAKLAGAGGLYVEALGEYIANSDKIAQDKQDNGSNKD